MKNEEIVQEMKQFNANDLYFLIDLTQTMRREFFESEFPDGNYDYDADEVTINGTKYSISRIMVNGEQFLIKDCEIVKCTPIN